MPTPIVNRDLAKEAPHSPRIRFGGFVILARTVDKCRASIAGKLGEFHYDCPLDNQLFGFKGINGSQFKANVASAKNYEDVAKWLQGVGTPKTAAEIKEWSDKVEAFKLRDVPTFKDPEVRKEIQGSCEKLGVDFDSATLFEWLDADDEASFKGQSELASR
jgi:alkanesulfonate monooxygenase SsuD/methylene tetrahydromethanopterin reductase-like flavin-dependent oxidoreductase (luciferase family)